MSASTTGCSRLAASPLLLVVLCSLHVVGCLAAGISGPQINNPRRLAADCDLSKLSCQLENNVCQPSQVPEPQRCDVVQRNKQCTDGVQFIEYLPLFYCSSFPAWVMAATFSVWMLLLFYGMSTVAEAFLCPSVKFISEALHLPSDIAGVTVFAFATGAPDIFTQIAAINEGEHIDIQLAVSSTLGSGLFIVCVVLAVVVLLPENGVQLKDPFAFLREAAAYLFACLLILAVLWDDTIRILEAVILLAGYLIYLTFCLYTMRVRESQDPVSAPVAQDPLRQKRSKPLDVKNIPFQSVPRQDVDIEMSETAFGDALIRASLSGQALEPVGRQPKSSGHLRSQKSIDKDLDVLPTVLSGTQVTFKESVTAMYGALAELLYLHGKPWWLKAFALLCSPIVLLMHATMPSVHGGTYCLRYCMLLSVVGPPFFLVGIGVYPWEWNPHQFLALWAAAGIGMYVVQLACFQNNGSNSADRANVLFALFSFVQSMVWMSLLANEVAALFEGLGNMLEIQEDILGATLLAWGETFPDLVSSVTMARSGFSAMAVSAAFGGPTLNLLVGTGASVFAAVLRHGDVPAELTNGIIMLIICSCVIMLFCLAIPVLYGWKLPRKVAVTMLLLYAGSLAVFFLSDSRVVVNMQRRVLDVGTKQG